MQRERAILLRSARVSSCGRDDGSDLVELVRGDVDWDRVSDSAWTHGITPLIYRSLAGLPEGCVPASVLERLRASFHRQGLMIHIQIRELHDVMFALRAAGVPVLVFKGPALGAQAYGNPLLRKPGDLDLLIREEHIRAARAVLEGMEYRGHVPAEGEGRYLRTRGGMAFSRGSLQVDLHWTLEQRRFDSLPFTFRLASDDVWHDAPWVVVAEERIQTLSPKHHLLFLCFHGAKHFWQRLYMLCDVAELIRSFPELDWSAVRSHARDLKMTRILKLGIHLAHRHLDAPVPEPELSELDDDFVHAAGFQAGDLLFEPAHALDSHLFRIGMLESLPDKLSYVFNRSWRKLSKLDWSF